MLSSQYHIGPLVYGTFENGRIEEYFESTTLTPNDIREPLISRWIGARMAELHSVDIDVVEGNSTQTREGKGWETGVEKNVRLWLGPARQVLALPSISDIVRRDLDLHRFEQEWHRYMLWLSKVDDLRTGSRRVFAHNDTQYGNLLRLKHPSEGLDEHRQVCHINNNPNYPCRILKPVHLKIVVVDFEYASSNPAAFDIANHFHEWTANYHSSTPHLLDFTRYPSFQERRNFYIAYVQHTTILGEDPVMEEPELERLVLDLDQQVRGWSPASHAMWAIWGIVQAREDIEGNNTDPEFDYIGYACGRLAAFRNDIQNLGF
jgi:choline kinase